MLEEQQHPDGAPWCALLVTGAALALSSAAILARGPTVSAHPLTESSAADHVELAFKLSPRIANSTLSSGQGKHGEYSADPGKLEDKKGSTLAQPPSAMPGLAREPER